MAAVDPWGDVIRQLRHCILPSVPMDSLVEQAFEEMKSRLKTSEISMLPSRLVEKPQISRFNPGENWLALDFGGSFVKLGFPLGTSLNIDELRIQTIEDRNINLEFFDRIVEWICRQVEDVIRKRKLENCTKFHLAVAFSFPLNNSNQLLEVGKGYQIGEDIKHASITAVSYTHLDVYKRQVFTHLNLSETSLAGGSVSYINIYFERLHDLANHLGVKLITGTK